ncbi:XRE family transcriptional regulator [bacterium D16-50]|jgi:transcriptional regulator with XRE-family HTH domain|nr:helix-turn-helix transcriptional regulator [Lachnospiraceae bacterium]RKJ20355.1 XRE family transcriptional regulator [bacterium D16-50]
MEQKLRCDLDMGSNLRKMRKAKGLSQEKLCAELQRRSCDIGRSTYEKYENGVLNIRISVLVALRKIYGCDYGAFFEGMDQEEV